MRPLNSYHDLGKQSALKGKTVSDNPFDVGTVSHLEWESGVSGRDVNLEVLTIFNDIRNNVPSAQDIARAIDIDLSEWPMNCYAIASEILQSGVLSDVEKKFGKLFLTYGMYIGKIDRMSPFARNGIAPEFARHGWLESPNGFVIDPTKFVFLARSPEIIVSSIDEYDVGGVRFREKMQGKFDVSVLPEATANRKVDMSMAPDNVINAFNSVLNKKAVDDNKQINFGDMYLVSKLSLEDMGHHGADILEGFQITENKALMPIDIMNWITDYSQWKTEQNNNVSNISYGR